jgi:allantoin racemase
MIAILNPNSTVSMTDAMLRTGRATLPGVVIEGWTSHDGPPAIQGRHDGEAAIAPLLRLVVQVSDAGADVIIIGCFDDTGLAAARQAAACPVIGIGQAAYHLATLAGDRFSVVTTLQVSVPILEENIAAYGFGRYLSRVRASGVAVLELESDPDAAIARVLEEVAIAASQDGVDSIVLGCAGMVDVAALDKSKMPVRLIDGVRAAVQLAHLI